uniref:Uncharacterized protein n=1 Tax=Bracon brevicornis TaxID=1563983 RepID=A0A6V7KRR2_9HYME
MNIRKEQKKRNSYLSLVCLFFIIPYKSQFMAGPKHDETFPEAFGYYPEPVCATFIGQSWKIVVHFRGEKWIWGDTRSAVETFVCPRGQWKSE